MKLRWYLTFLSSAASLPLLFFLGAMVILLAGAEGDMPAVAAVAGAGLVLFLAGLGLTWALARRVERPVRLLGETAGALERGEVVTWVPSGIEEVDRLGKALEQASLMLQQRLAERERVEAELQRLNVELEKRVKERSDKLFKANLELLREIMERDKLETELRQAQRLELIGTLAGGVAHDFNNILAIILAYASNLRAGLGEAGNHFEEVEAIYEAAQRGAALVQQLLTIARKTDARFEPVDINAAALRTAKILEETFPRTINTSLHLDPELPPVMADENQLLQVLLNLCTNARDAMPRGGLLVLETGRVAGADLRKRFKQAGDREYVCLRVSDNGEGMDEATRRRIFEPFFTTKERGKGTGLGLAVVYGIVKAHDGFIDVQSKKGLGTSCWVYLPASSQRLEVSKPDGRGSEERICRDHTVLLAEDEERLRTFLKSVLEKEGYRVIEAEDGAKAVEIYRRRQEEIALLILDSGLPEITGWDAFLRIKEISPEVRAILISGYVDPGLKTEMSKSGISHFLQKPFLREELLRTVREAVRPS